MKYNARKSKNIIIDKLPLSVLKTYKKLITVLPDLFNPTNILPLAKNCKKDIIHASGLSHTKVSQFLNEYTRFALYKLAVTKNKVRFDIRGKACGEITQFEKDSALKALLAYEKSKNKSKPKPKPNLKPKPKPIINKSLPPRSWGRSIDKKEHSAKL